MSFPLFLRGFIGLLLVFAVVTYVITGSLWSTFIETVICGVLVQAGYFAAVLFLVWRSGRAQKTEAKPAAPAEAARSIPPDEAASGKVARIPGSPSSDHP
jgi:exopolysaccharide production repressor protein